MFPLHGIGGNAPTGVARGRLATKIHTTKISVCLGELLSGHTPCQTDTFILKVLMSNFLPFFAKPSGANYKAPTNLNLESSHLRVVKSCTAHKETILGLDHQRRAKGGLISLLMGRTVGHKSHDPSFHVFLMEAGVMTFVTHCTFLYLV